MNFTYPNNLVCPHRTWSTFLWQPTLVTFIQNGAFPSKKLKWNLFVEVEGHQFKTTNCTGMLMLASMGCLRSIG